MQCVSTMGTYCKKEVIQAGAGVPFMMYQLYVFRDRDFVQTMVQGTPDSLQTLPTDRVVFAKLYCWGWENICPWLRSCLGLDM